MDDVPLSERIQAMIRNEVKNRNWCNSGPVTARLVHDLYMEYTALHGSQVHQVPVIEFRTVSR